MIAPTAFLPITPRLARPQRRVRFPTRIRPACHASSPTPTPSPPPPLLHSILHAPPEPGIYRFFSASGHVLYIGKARSLRSRLRHYITLSPTSPTGLLPSTSVSPRIAAMVQQATALDVMVTRTEAAALALEASLVAECRPMYNVLLKDDRRYPYAKITYSDAYPRVVLTRERTAKREGDRIYGPFVDEAMLRRVLNTVYEVFPLRQRARRLFSDRVCMNYDMGRCPGVCQDLISADDYKRTVDKVDKLLSGRVDEVVLEMRGEMKELSDMMRYEEAAKVRDRIRLLQSVFEGGVAGSSVAGEIEAAASMVEEDMSVSRDVFCLGRGVRVGKVVLFQVRGGKVIGRLVFSVEVMEGVSDGELLETVVESHYAGLTHPMGIPEEVVLGVKTDGMEMLRSVLREKRGKKVGVKVGRGGRLKHLVEIAKRNAQVEVELEERRVVDLKRDVRELEEMLTPYFSGTLSEKANVVSGVFKFSLIEAYDISHTSGANAVGSRVVFKEGVPVPSDYRKYHIDDNASSKGHPDDFESIRQVMRKRFGKSGKNAGSGSSNKTQLPDLVLIDGGKGQLSAAMEALKELGLDQSFPVVSLAKREEEIFVPARAESINYDEEAQAWIMNGGVRLLCHIRDEAHRTAIHSHRKRRGRQALRSGLGSVPGLGSIKKAALLDHFKGSPEAVSQASLQDLERVAGIGAGLAKRIFDHFHPSVKERGIHEATDQELPQ